MFELPASDPYYVHPLLCFRSIVRFLATRKRRHTEDGRLPDVEDGQLPDVENGRLPDVEDGRLPYADSSELGGPHELGVRDA